MMMMTVKMLDVMMIKVTINGLKMFCVFKVEPLDFLVTGWNNAGRITRQKLYIFAVYIFRRLITDCGWNCVFLNKFCGLESVCMCYLFQRKNIK